MKKLFLPLFLIISSVVFGQGLPFPNYQQFASPTTRTNFLGAAHTQKGLINGMYQDTTVANQGFIDFYPGAQIVTISPANAVWLRNSTATEWIRQASSSNSPPPSVVTIITDSSIQICNVNSCDTFVVNVTAQTINIQNDSTIIVCSFGGSCDTITINSTPLIPTGVFVDSVFMHNGILTDSLFYSKDGDTTLVNVFDRNCGLINGGTVTYNSLLIFDIAPSVFVDCCTGIRYAFDGAQKTLAVADATFARNDAIIVSSAGISVLTGTPSANPAFPQVTPCQELLTFINVPAGATTITCSTPDIIVYDENTTWTVSTTSVTANADNLVNPFHLVKAIDVGAVTTASKITFTTTAFDISPYTTLKFYVRLKSVFTNNTQITLRWLTTAGAFGSNTLSIPNNAYGFNRNTINAYQAISIPMSDFQFTASTSTITALQIGFGASNATGLYFDYIQLGGACINQPQTITFPNSFGVLNTVSGAAIATQPTDIAQVVGTGTVTVSAAGKTLTINGATSGSTITIINDSTVQVCTALGSCQTIVFDDVDAQNVFVVNDTTLLVCNVDNTLCDTVDIPTPVFFDRGFFDPDQASFNNTIHTMNTNDLRLIGGTLDINDDGLAIRTRSVITPIIAVNDHTDLNTVKTGYYMSRTVAGNGAAGLGIQLRTAIDNASSNQVAASDLITEWSVATAGSETATMKFNVVGAGTLANRFSIEGSTRIIADGIRLQDAKGANVTAANDLTLGNGGNLFTIDGATQINAITTTNWQAGSNIAFIFNAAPLVKNSTAGGANTATMLLAGRVDFQAAAGDYIAFEYDGTNWYETNRKLAASSTGLTFSNYITESAGTVKLGGAGVDAITTLTLAEKQILLTANTLAGTSALKLTSTSTLAAGSAQRMIEVALSGTNANASQNTWGIHSTNSHGGGGTNIAVFGNASGGTLNYAVSGQTSASLGAAVRGLSSGTAYAVEGSNTSTGLAVFASSVDNYSVVAQRIAASTNTVIPVIQVSRASTGTVANGIGGSIEFFTETDGASQISSTIESSWTDVTSATRTSRLAFTTVNSAAQSTKLTIEGDGRIYGTALHNNAGAVTGTTTQYIASGTYTPDLFNTTNVSASTAYVCQWMRVGNVVTVSGKVDIDATLAAATELGMSLPIASAFAAEENLGGSAVSAAAASLSAAVRGDVANDRISIVFIATSLTNDSYYFEYSYVIL